MHVSERGKLQTGQCKYRLEKMEKHQMNEVFIIGLGGFIGAISRYGLSGIVNKSGLVAFPLGTLLVNIIGCFIIGAISATIDENTDINPNLRHFVIVGLLGSFTTFSAFGYDTFKYLQNGEYMLGAWNISMNVILGLAAVLAGRLSVRFFAA